MMPEVPLGSSELNLLMYYAVYTYSFSITYSKKKID